MKSYTFQIFYFNEKTREVEVTATCKTKKIAKDRLPEVIRQELAKSKTPCCYKVVTRD